MNKKYIVSMIVIMLAISAVTIKTANAFYIGQRGSDVAELQASLIEEGYDIPAITVGGASFGYFGNQTQKALTERDGVKPTLKLGSVAGPDTYYDYIANNDFREYSQTRGLITSTTTVCAIRSPLNATTTGWGAITLRTSSTTASLVTIAKATTGFATTTALATSTVAANAQVSFTTASTTPEATASTISFNRLFSPGNYMVFGMQDTTAEATAGTFSPTGQCSARFTRI